MNSHDTSDDCSRIPPWLRVRLPAGGRFAGTKRLVENCGLHTVCSSARCPNIWECFERGTATFLILGDRCTRGCTFCNIERTSRPGPPDADEPRRVAEAAAELGVRHVVVTSVTRDDLPGGGADHFAATIRAVRQACPEARVEVLIPDFQGEEAALATVLEAGPDVLNHNVETAPRLYPEVRPQADFTRSLELLSRAKAAGALTKSGFMVGVGETDDEALEVIEALHDAGCSIVTIGQYMRPSREHLPVRRWVEPAMFERYADYARSIGVRHVFSAPLVRSSYRAEEAMDQGESR